jgi:hypothetical protein
MPDTRSDWSKKGWSRPLYVLRRGIETFCGYLERDGNRFALLTSHQEGNARIVFDSEELGNFGRVTGVAVPV